MRCQSVTLRYEVLASSPEEAKERMLAGEWLDMSETVEDYSEIEDEQVERVVEVPYASR